MPPGEKWAPPTTRRRRNDAERSGHISAAPASKSLVRGMLEDMHLPEPRGPLSEALCADLAEGTALSSRTADLARALPEPADPTDVLRDDDVQLSLAIC